MDFMFSRQFFLTQGNYMCLAQRTTRSNDLVYIFLGANTPFIIRPVTENHYQLISECYVNGLMYGEAMEGLKDGKYVLEDITLD